MSAKNSGVSRKNYTVWRGIVCAVLFFGAGIALFFHFGWGNLSSFGYQAIAYICPLGALETLLASKTLIPRVVIAVVIVLILAALFGRTFCAWVCPTPHLVNFFHPKKKSKQSKEQTSLDKASEPDIEQIIDLSESAERKADISTTGSINKATDNTIGEDLENQGAATKKTDMPLAPLGGKRNGFHADLRHVVLGGTLLSAAIFGFPVFCLICPIGLTFATFIAVFQLFGLHEPTWMLVVFPLILILELCLFKKWCHKICPLGALLSLVGQKSPFLKPQVKSDMCLRSGGENCKTCVNVCPEGLDPHVKGLGECTSCGLCAQACPAEAISLKLVRNFKDTSTVPVEDIQEK